MRLALVGDLPSRIVEMKLDAFTVGAALTSGFGLRACTFPSVRTLTIGSEGAHDMAHRNRLLPVFSSWTFPAIRKLSISGVPPPLESSGV